MTNSGEVVWTALDGALPGIGLHGMTQDLMPGDMPANIRAALLHIAVIDSHSLTRECIANSVSYMSEDIKVFSFSSALDCNDRRTYQFSLIVLYLHGSEYEPLEVIRSLRSAHEESTIFVISDHDYQTNSEFIRVAWRFGARGFVSTRTTGLTLALSAIRFVQAGGFFAPFDALLSRSAPASMPSPARQAGAELTARETVVLGLLKEGKTNKVIARELRLSSNTVKVHVHNILRKMQVGTRVEAASIVSRTVAADDEPVLVI
jgi:DNA-binding NarL/FixJ family response regulator